MTTDELVAAVESVVPRRLARQLITRATRVAGVRRSDALPSSDLLLVLESLAAEGGELQALVERLARRTLYPGERE